MPYQPTCDKKFLLTFYSQILHSFFFLLPPPMGFYFCLPADKATVKSVKNNSPTDLEMQTAVASKGKGFFDKAYILSTYHDISQPP